MAKKKAKDVCNCDYHDPQKKGLWMLVLGLLILGNAFWVWTADWWIFAGYVLTAFGIVKLFFLK